MARSIDLSRLPPPEATCFACERTVQLDRRARRAGKFRCPHCRADNKVGPDGLGHSLDNLAERVDQMPRTRCHCGVENRLPRAIVAAGRYTCWECKRVQPVPRTLRKRAGFASKLAIVLSLTMFFGTVGWSLWRIGRTLREFGSVFSYSPAESYNADQALSLDEPRPLPPSAQGQPYELQGKIVNQMNRPVTFFIQGWVYEDKRPLASSIIPVRLLKPGEVRTWRMRIVDPRRMRANSVQIQILGVS